LTAATAELNDLVDRSRGVGGEHVPTGVLGCL
jgi:hypothetical protein